MTNRTCSFPECNRAHHSRGYCKAHYKQVAKGATPHQLHARLSARTPRADLFWAKVIKAEGCWEWSGGHVPEGYGRFNDGNGTTGAHRYSWSLANGPIPPKTDIDHICHNRGCVRPDHLRATTRKQNIENRSGLYKSNKTGVHGVRWDERRRKYIAQVRHNGKYELNRGFTTLDEAASAVVEARLKLFTHNDADRVKA